MKIALLSNVNCDFVINLLASELDIVPSVGYGDVSAQMLNPESVLNAANPDVIFIIIDIEQLIDGSMSFEEASRIIDDWFGVLDASVKKERDYFVSDVIFRSEILSDNDELIRQKIISHWVNSLDERISSHVNIHALNLSGPITKAGSTSVFSSTAWYMGKIPYSSAGSRLVAEEVSRALGLMTRTPKKVLVLDLDNTLWGGILGELGPEGIDISDDHTGAVYRKVQQYISAIKNTGIILAIASKNNEADVSEVWEKNSHMVLKREDFVSVKINWNDKADSLREISSELNLGLDAFVFIDDMPAERDNIRSRLPEVTVPEFPSRLEAYPDFMAGVFRDYFMRLRHTQEDTSKTRQYIENAKRNEASKGLSYEEFIESLEIKAERIELNELALDRIAQMHGKTNQFNLTTRRYTRQDIDRMLSQGWRVYAYRVKDKFGDYGIVAAVIVDTQRAEINSFLMSCRVMGKMIENYVIDDVESDLLSRGITSLHAIYIPTQKNAPVSELYESLGYTLIPSPAPSQETQREPMGYIVPSPVPTHEDTPGHASNLGDNGTKYYELDLTNRPARKHFVNHQRRD